MLFLSGKYLQNLSKMFAGAKTKFCKIDPWRAHPAPAATFSAPVSRRPVSTPGSPAEAFS
jgi:hypothetical protein